MQKEKSYWNNFYGGHSLDLSQCSSFARYVLDEHRVRELLTPSSLLMDVGCGNGRDTEFWKMNVSAIGVDASQVVIDQNTRIGNAEYVCADACAIDFEKYNPDVVYSRFFVHALDSAQQRTFLDNLMRVRKGAVICVETRSVNDPLNGKGSRVEGEKNMWRTSHRRRFSVLLELKDEFTQRNFEVIRCEEDATSSWMGDDHACVCRLIVEK